MAPSVGGSGGAEAAPRSPHQPHHFARGRGRQSLTEAFPWLLRGECCDELSSSPPPSREEEEKGKATKTEGGGDGAAVGRAPRRRRPGRRRRGRSMEERAPKKKCGVNLIEDKERFKSKGRGDRRASSLPKQRSTRNLLASFCSFSALEDELLSDTEVEEEEDDGRSSSYSKKQETSHPSSPEPPTPAAMAASKRDLLQPRLTRQRQKSAESTEGAKRLLRQVGASLAWEAAVLDDDESGDSPEEEEEQLPPWLPFFYTSDDDENESDAEKEEARTARDEPMNHGGMASALKEMNILHERMRRGGSKSPDPISQKAALDGGRIEEGHPADSHPIKKGRRTATPPGKKKKAASATPSRSGSTQEDNGSEVKLHKARHPRRLTVDFSEVAALVDELVGADEVQQRRARRATIAAGRRSSIAERAAQIMMCFEGQQQAGDASGSDGTIDPTSALWDSHDFAAQQLGSDRGILPCMARRAVMSDSIRALCLEEALCCNTDGAAESFRRGDPAAITGPLGLDRKMSSGRIYLKILEDYHGRRDAALLLPPSPPQEEEGTAATASDRTIESATDCLWSDRNILVPPKSSRRNSALLRQSGRRRWSSSVGCDERPPPSSSLAALDLDVEGTAARVLSGAALGRAARRRRASSAAVSLAAPGKTTTVTTLLGEEEGEAGEQRAAAAARPRPPGAGKGMKRGSLYRRTSC